MRLVDLLYKVYENTTVWIAEDPSISEGIYFGPAKEITLRTAAAYEVVEVYPEHYPAINNYPWLTDGKFAIYSVAAATVWLHIGSSFLFLLVGFRNVPEDLLESARLDGAGRLTRIFKIMFPIASPQIFFVVFLNITSSFKAFGEIRLLTAGGPAKSTTTLVYAIYEQAMQNGRFETACIYSICLFLVIFLVTRIQLLVEKRVVFYD